MRLPLAPLVVVLVLAGCVNAPAPDPGVADTDTTSGQLSGGDWPDLHGAKVTVLAYDSFQLAFAPHASAFHNLTNGTVELVVESDAGKALERAMREKGNPSFDVLYGVDNVLAGRAIREGVFEPYKPTSFARVNSSLAFLPNWEATPVNHGYVAVNVDARSNLSVLTLDDVKRHASELVLEDPRLSTPGLGFLVATVATYGESDADGYDYLDYWRELFAGGALVAPDWTVAYVQHFSGGYGQFTEGAKSDRSLAVSYTTSPAYEVFFGYDRVNDVVLAPNATFHQIQTVGLMKGAKNAEAARAWIEYCLTDAFQGAVASGEAVYPVVDNVSVEDVFQGNDPRPGSFAPAGFDHAALDANAARWVREWTDAYEAAQAG